MIFAHARQWRDHPGFNAYFLRAAFPSVNVETKYDWNDRVDVTYAPGMLFFTFIRQRWFLNPFRVLKMANIPLGPGTSQLYFLQIALRPSEAHTAVPKTNA
jgi:hypothetical protein